MDLRQAQETFIRELPLLDRILSAVCRRNRLAPADAEDFASAVRLKLIENDYAAIRSFEGKSSFSTWLMVVVQRLLLDHRNQLWGKWRPSAEATRLGETALLLERLLSRDGKTMEEAAVLIAAERGTAPSIRELETIAAALPRRTARPVVEPFEPGERTDPAIAPDAEVNLIRGERERLGGKAATLLTDCMGRLDAEDRLIMRMRFLDGLSVAQLSRALGRDQRQLYYRIERIALALRTTLESAGIDKAAARELLEEGGVASLSIDFTESSRSEPSIETEGRRRGSPEVRAE